MTTESDYLFELTTIARVIIIGAAIAGKAADIGLRRLKIETLIVEQATELGEVGPVFLYGPIH